MFRSARLGGNGKLEYRPDEQSAMLAFVTDTTTAKVLSMGPLICTKLCGLRLRAATKVPERAHAVDAGKIPLGAPSFAW